MELNPSDRSSQSKGDWVELVKRWRETVGKDEIVVIAQFLGTSLKTITRPPQVDIRQIEFQLLQPKFQDGTGPALCVQFPDDEEDMVCSTVTSAKGTICFATAIWPLGLERQHTCIEIWFSTDQALLAQEAPESLDP